MNDLSSRIRVALGDITLLDVDVIVTAANEALRGGGGVDGAVHCAAGPELAAASRRLAPCPPGEARITAGFELSATHVIHAVGPVFRDGASGEAAKLASAYRNSLALAAENGLSTIAFPSISTGVYGYPKESAARIAIDTVIEWLRHNELPGMVTFCCFDPSDKKRYLERLGELGITSQG